MKPATNSLAKKKHAIPHVYIILAFVSAARLGDSRVLFEVDG